MKRIMLFFAVALAVQAFAMELPQTFAPVDKNAEEEKNVFLYQDQEAIHEFASTIDNIILSSLKDQESNDKLIEALSQFAHKHTKDAEVFWKLNKGRTLAQAKAMRDHARTLSINDATNDALIGEQLSRSRVDPKLLRTNVNIGYLNDFNEIIEKIKNLQQ